MFLYKAIIFLSLIVLGSYALECSLKTPHDLSDPIISFNLTIDEFALLPEQYKQEQYK